MELEYLFVCHFNDGTTLYQTPEDVSSIDLTRSTYFDVEQRIDDVFAFGLVSADDDYLVASVYLDSGHFEISGVPFKVHEKKDFPEDSKLKLAYFRRCQQIVTMGGVCTERVEYHLGWTTTIDGNEVQQTISIM